MDKTISVDDFCGTVSASPKVSHWEVHFSTEGGKIMYLTHPHKFIKRENSVCRRIITPYRTAAQKFKDRNSAINAMLEMNWAGKDTYAPEEARLVRIESKDGTLVSRLEYSTSLKGNQVSKTDTEKKTVEPKKMVHPKKKSDETQRMKAVCGIDESGVLSIPGEEKTKTAAPPPPPPPLPKAVKATATTTTPTKKLLPQPKAQCTPTSSVAQAAEAATMSVEEARRIMERSKTKTPPAVSNNPALQKVAVTALEKSTRGMSAVEAKKIVEEAKAQAKGLVAAAKEKPTASSSTDQAVIQEWTAKIRRITRDSSQSGSVALDRYYANKSILLREHVIASALAFIPKTKKMARIRTLKKLLDISTGAAKAIYDNVGDLIPHIEHPEFNSFSSSSVQIPPRALYSLQKKIRELQQVREDLSLEIKTLDWEVGESREACVAIAAEAMKVLDFVKGQFEEVFSTEDYASQREFGFMHRVLKNEITTFTKAHEEAEQLRDGLNASAN